MLEAAQLQAGLALQGYFARGAITFGKFHFYGNLIFGPALVEAVQIERSVAVNPRIVLSPGATLALREGGTEKDDGDLEEAESPVLLDADGLAFVDYLRGSLQADANLGLASTLAAHRDVVAEQLDTWGADFPRWSKYRWVAEYHNAACGAYRHQLEPPPEGFTDLLIRAVHTHRSLAPLR